MLDADQPLDNSNITGACSRVMSRTRFPACRSLPAGLSTYPVAEPQLAFPINSQVPPVAYASQPYDFVFSETTFVSSAPQISYTITNGPNWLEIDSASRRFSGVPNGEEVGAATIQLVASDSTGQTSTSFTFVVAESSDLHVDAPILPQLERSGATSSPNSLLAHRQEPFNLSFGEDTFRGAVPATRYYAVSADNTPLPPWVQFDEYTLSFSGTTPALVSALAGPQTYGLRLIASNVPGFAEAAIDFDIVISRRVFGFSTASQNISISPSVPFQSASFRSFLSLDGQAVADNQLASVDADVPTWVSFDKNQLSLSGTPSVSTNATITISVTDIYGDVAHATVFLQGSANGSELLGTLAVINVTAGEYFSYTLATPSFSHSTRAIADLDDAYSWLNFDPSSWTLSGHVPVDQNAQPLDIRITFEDTASTATGDVVLQVVHATRATGVTSTQVSKTQTLPKASVTSEGPVPATSPRNQKTSNRHALHVTLAIVFPLFAASLVLLLFLCCLRRKKHSKRRVSKNSVEDSPGSGEGPGQEPAPRTALSTEILGLVNPQQPAPPRPPRLDLQLPNDSMRQSRQSLSAAARLGPLSQHRISQIFADDPGLATGVAIPRRAANTAESGETTDFAPAAASVNQGALPQGPLSSIVSRSSIAGRQSWNRHSSRLSQQIVLPAIVGLPDRRSGAGHGAGLLLPPDATASRMSWRDTWTSYPSIDPRRTTVVLESFPAPPGDGSDSGKSLPRTKIPPPLLRVVSEDSDEAMSFEEQRQRWHTERARARLEGISRFSNEGSARMMGSNRTPWRARDNATEKSEPSKPISKPKVLGERSYEHSWSEWSGVGPAARESSQVRSPSVSHILSRPVSRRRPSVASSGQFESVTSSDSQWEDEEDLEVEESKEGFRQWQTYNRSQASPRLPLSPVPASRENSDRRSASDYTRYQTRVAAGRWHVSVEERGLTRSYGSQSGSFRFL
ncbi:hypothetical protein A1O7_02972 [Cladophialophora yegresii CBS 114405]|uniref:Dystroglycan-type cadherin-like domain-containing protein n=1 Tax=Cladophialophora yegresii CBS 114405 TaxID=1182544 RepID=W9WW62_9EURO|nr:uncharacterized protein A1O7_02972 [Cladophialophora yegresii CBS 114405]EXJ62534.1 hypothetical protein A1O7_02972 [Cladophialophora yegresii CBS 114405]